MGTSLRKMNYTNGKCLIPGKYTLNYLPKRNANTKYNEIACFTRRMAEPLLMY